MIVPKTELTKAIQKVYASTSSATDNDPTARKDHFIFTGDVIAGYNGYFAIITPFETDFACTVNAAMMQQIVKSLRGDDVHLIQLDGILHIKCGNTQAEVLIDEDFEGQQFLEDELNLPHIDDTKYWKPLPEDFVQGLRMCFFSALKKNSQPYLNALYINEDEIISGDRSRVSVFTMDNSINGEALMPLDIAKQVVKFSDEFDFYYISANSIVFASLESKFFIARTISLKYPDVSAAIATKKLAMKIKFPESIFGDLETICSVSKLSLNEIETIEAVVVRVNRNDITITQTSKLGNIATCSKHDNKKIKNVFTFTVNPGFLLEVLRISDTLRIYKPETEGSKLCKGVFKTDNFFHVIALEDISNRDIPF